MRNGQGHHALHYLSTHVGIAGRDVVSDLQASYLSQVFGVSQARNVEFLGVAVA